MNAFVNLAAARSYEWAHVQYPLAIMVGHRQCFTVEVAVKFRVLGAVQINVAGQWLRVERPRRRALLAYLLLSANTTVTVARLTEALWGPHPPSTSRSQLKNDLAAIRRNLAEAGYPDLLRTQTAGYQIDLEPGDLDLLVFTQRVQQAESELAAGRAAPASDLFRSALSLFSGPALADLRAWFTESAQSRLEELRLAVAEQLAEVDLLLGRHLWQIAELTELVAQHPLRERLRGLLMVALYRGGRRAEALAVARDLRKVLIEQHGLDPQQEFTELEARILRGDPGLAPEPDHPISTQVPAQLPKDIYAFVGREVELKRLAAVADEVDGPNLLLIAGNAGVGKTALATHWAHRIAPSYPDGQLYLNLRGFDPGSNPIEPLDALARFLRALGADDAEIPREVDEAAALFRSLLAGRRMLVLLDNAHSAEQVRPLLPGARSCLVAVTSRRALHGLIAHEGAHLLELGVLCADDAKELLSTVLHDGSFAVDVEATDELSRRCGYLPLALRLAAAHLTCHRHLPIARYTSELAGDDPLAALDRSAGETATVSAAFGVSYRELSPAAQRMLRLATLAPGADFSLATAAALTGQTFVQAGQSIGELRAMHLINEDQPQRYSMHDLLRSYCSARAMDEDSAQARSDATRRMIDFYGETVHHAYPLLQPVRAKIAMELAHPPLETLEFSDRAAAIDWYDKERESLLGAIELAFANGWFASAWQLNCTLFPFFLLRRHWPEWLRALQIALAAAEQAQDLNARLITHNIFGIACRQMGENASARHHFTCALELGTTVGAPSRIAAAHVNLADVCIAEGRLEEGVAHLRIALQDPGYGHEPALASVTYHTLGCALLDMQDLGEAKAALTKSLELAHASGDPLMAGYAHLNLSEVALSQAQVGTARAHAEQQLELAVQTSDPLLHATALDVLASCLAVKSLPTAREHWRSALRLYRELNHRREQSLADWLATIETQAEPVALTDLQDVRLHQRHLR
ncbi:AfsR/SARP family transcriptional regulator [Rhizocola hellebori]|uniref:AfsR/SARP family transcriptional regulator n=1 Tax=Rhizocola hellebori TaxID=1392758 RepID=UPI0019406725|nr:BTAD domain-containing putative transcriptional regulator [Rhizocola hellebori]